MGHYYNRNKGDVERVVMQSRVSLNSYNVNAESYNDQRNYKAKTLIMEWYGSVLALLGKRVRLLAASRRLSPKWLLAQLLLLELIDNSKQNAIHKINERDTEGNTMMLNNMAHGFYCDRKPNYFCLKNFLH
jgi:hypothetical protein